MNRKFSALSFSSSDYLVSSSLELPVITPMSTGKHQWKLYTYGCIDL